MTQLELELALKNSSYVYALDIDDGVPIVAIFYVVHAGDTRSCIIRLGKDKEAQVYENRAIFMYAFEAARFGIESLRALEGEA